MLRIVKLAGTCVVVLSLALTASAKTGVRIGAPAPQLQLEFPFGKPSNAALTRGHAPGRALVLEFWATYCGPCLEAAPRLHALMEQFKDAPVDLVAVTDEEEPAVRSFLARHPLDSLVAIDKGSQTTRAFGVAFLPSTVLIDPQDRLAAITTPAHVDAAVLKRLIAGDPLDLPLPIALARADGENTLLSAVIRPSLEGDGEIAIEGDQLVAQGATLEDLVSRAYDLPARRVQVAAGLATRRYDALIERSGAAPGVLLELLKQVLPAALQVEIRRETRPAPVLVLSAPANAPANVRKSAPDTDSVERGGEGSLQFSGAPMSHLALALGHILERDVVDETGLTGRYDLTLAWDPQRPASMLDAVRTQLGLLIATSERPVEFVVIRERREAKEQ